MNSKHFKFLLSICIAAVLIFAAYFQSTLSFSQTEQLSQENEWQQYQNDEFGYSLSVPTTTVANRSCVYDSQQQRMKSGDFGPVAVIVQENGATTFITPERVAQSQFDADPSCVAVEYRNALLDSEDVVRGFTIFAKKFESDITLEKAVRDSLGHGCRIESTQLVQNEQTLQVQLTRDLDFPINDKELGCQILSGQYEVRFNPQEKILAYWSRGHDDSFPKPYLEIDEHFGELRHTYDDEIAESFAFY